MRTIKQVSELTGVSVRTLQYYDKIGLLLPTAHTESGYRLYDDTALERLQQILLFRELEFPLKDIRHILETPDFDKNKALQQQIELLTLKKEHIENLILLARGIWMRGTNHMSFEAFDTKKIDEYAKQAKESWGTTAAYQEYEQKHSSRTAEENHDLSARMMAIIAEFGALKEKSPEDAAVQAQVKKLQNFITEHYYTCTDEILASLGSLYAGGGAFTENIDAAGGAGTAEFIRQAIQFFCK